MVSYLSISAICYVVGVYLCDFFPDNRTGEAAVVIILISAVLLLMLRKYRNYILLAALFLCLGMLGCNIAKDLRYNEFYTLNNKYVTVEGYVAELPEQNGDIYSYRVKTTYAEYLGKEYEAGQVIKVSSEKALRYGDNIRIKGFLNELSEKKNSSDFNAKRYYQSKGIFFSMYAREVEFLKEKKAEYSITYWINLCKSKFSDAIDKEFSGDESAILKAVTLGNKRQFSDEFEALLLRTGVMKFFYPSFLHIYLISALVMILFAGVRKEWREYILIAFMIVYAAMNTHSPVFFKNAFAVIIGIIAMKKFGFNHSPDTIALAVLVTGFFNPLYYFHVGFVISVACGFMLYYFMEILEEWLVFIPFSWLRRLICFYIITTFGLLPIIAYYFNGISLYTNLLSPLYIVVVSGLIILVPVMCVLSAIFGTAFFVKTFIAWLLWYFTSLPGLINRLPFSYIWIKPPDFIFICAFFITLYIVYQAYRRELKKTHNIAAVCICAGLWCSISADYITSSGNMDIIFVNVGQGDGAVIDVQGGETLLIDGGGKYEFSDYDAGEKIYLPYLADNGYFNIDKAFISHYHSDHCLGVIAAMNTLNVKEVVMPDCAKENENRKEIERIAREKDIKLTYVLGGDKIELASGVVIDILSPMAEELTGLDENEASMVMRVQYNGFKCLFTGDISTEVERGLLETVGDCDVVKMAHHGSANSNCREFTEAVKAEYAVVSVGEDNIYGFPKKEAVYNYQQSGAKVARTDINGDITVTVNTDGEYEIYSKSRR